MKIKKYALPTELDDEEEDIRVVFTLLLLLFVGVSLNITGAIKLNPRNISWLLLLIGNPGESFFLN